MPKKAHEQLERQADRMKLTGERRKRYVYGTLAKIKKMKDKK